MNGFKYKDYFVRPVDVSHRRYEALRSVFVEEQPMRQVARRYEISYGTIRNWVSEFCRDQDSGHSPLFSPSHRVGVLQPTDCLPMTRMRKSKLPMFRHCR